MLNKSIVLIFLGDFFFDARCINMADTIIDAGMDLNIIDASKSDDQYRGGEIYHISLPQKGIFKYIKFYRETKKILAKINPQKIIAGDLYSLPAAESFKDAQIIFDSREIYSELAALTQKPFYQLFWLKFERYLIRKCDSIFVTAESDGTYLKSIYRKIPEPIVIRNLPSSKIIGAPNQCLRKQLQIAEKQKIFLYQGVIHPGRGLIIMVDLLEYFPDCVCVFIGKGDFAQKINDHAMEKQFSDRVFLIGDVPYNELLSYTAVADIGFSLIEPISKSYTHALPNKLFEYFLAGIPVIASDFPEMKNALQNYPSGAVVPPDDLSKIVDAVSNILAQPNNQEENQRVALDNFVWEIQGELFLKALGL